MPRFSRAATLALGAALALAVSGCGGGASDDPSVQALLRSVKADDELGARFTLRGSTTEDGETTSVRGYGQIEADEKRDRAVISARGQRIELVTDEPFLFLNIEGLPFGSSDDIPAGTKWVKINQDIVADAAGLGGLRSIEALGPTASLEFLADLDPQVEEAGSERIDGIQTKRYRVRVKFGKLFDELSERAEGVPKIADSERDKEARFVIWIDHEDLVRRCRLELDFEQESLLVTADVTAYDRDLRVRIPSGAGVYDATDAVAKAVRKEKQPGASS